MKFLLDTPLLSELLRAHTDDWSARWVDAFDEDEIYLSAITIGEVVQNIETEPDPDRRQALYDWLNEELLVRFHGRIIEPDLTTFIEWGKINVMTEGTGKTLSVVDALIAATVRVKGLVLITFNRDVFANLGLEVSDPWQG